MLLTLPSILDCPGCWGFTLAISQVIFKIQITWTYQRERLWFFHKIKNCHIDTIFGLETECINMWIKTVHESTPNGFFSWSDVGHYWILHVESNYFDFMFILVSKIRGRCHLRLLFASISPWFSWPCKLSTVLTDCDLSRWLSSVLDVLLTIQTCCFPITIIFSIIFHFVLFFSNSCNSCNGRIFVRCKLLVLPGNIKYLKHCILWKHTRNNILTHRFYSLSWH